MRAGTLRHAITVQQDTGTSRGSMGSHVESWVTFANRRASIAPLQGRERYEAHALAATVTHEVRMRYLNGIEPKKFRILFGNRVFDIQAIVNSEERNREMVLLCEEQV